MRDARVELPFADDLYSFRLAWGELIELQEKCDAGPYVVLQKLLDGTWQMQMISEVIRLGLIGGGKVPVDALKLVNRYVKSRPPTENVDLAQAVLMAGLMGAPEEKIEPKRAAKSSPLESGTNGKLPTVALYGNGAIMGYTPQQVNGMSVWQYTAAWEGYKNYHAGDETGLSESEAKDLFDFVQEFDGG